jgi:hypothetical protein
MESLLGRARGREVKDEKEVTKVQDSKVSGWVLGLGYVAAVACIVTFTVQRQRS